MLQVIDLILLYDGDVMKFAGDSMIVAFSPGKDEKADEDGGLKAATVRCLHCATHLVDKYGVSRRLVTCSQTRLLCTLSAMHQVVHLLLWQRSRVWH